MRLVIRNRQRAHRLSRPALRQAAQTLARLAQRRAGEAPPWREVILHLLDDRGMAEVNQRILKHDGPTDVISQRYTPLPGEPPGAIGELFVNVACAVHAAPRRAGWSPDRELALYLAHGFDHLTGACDHTPAARRRMRRRELAWLRSVPLTPLFQSSTL